MDDFSVSINAISAARLTRSLPRSPPMDNTTQFVPFPLFHGTSSHFLSAFKPGTTPSSWPYKDEALSLLNDVWFALRAFGREPCWFVERVLNQASGHSNWQHGELYLTPSKLAAVQYACGGAKYGGELLTFCNAAVDALAELDQTRADCLIQSAKNVAGFLKGTKSPPLLVELGDVKVADLSTERPRDDVLKALRSLANEDIRGALGSDERVREIMGQQTNFRLPGGCGLVKHVFEVRVEDIDNPSPAFNLKEIRNSELWD